MDAGFLTELQALKDRLAALKFEWMDGTVPPTEFEVDSLILTLLENDVEELEEAETTRYAIIHDSGNA